MGILTKRDTYIGWTRRQLELEYKLRKELNIKDSLTKDLRRILMEMKRDKKRIYLPKQVPVGTKGYTVRKLKGVYKETTWERIPAYGKDKNKYWKVKKVKNM